MTACHGHHWFVLHLRASSFSQAESLGTWDGGGRICCAGTPTFSSTMCLRLPAAQQPKLPDVGYLELKNAACSYTCSIIFTILCATGTFPTSVSNMKAIDVFGEVRYAVPCYAMLCCALSGWSCRGLRPQLAATTTSYLWCTELACVAEAPGTFGVEHSVPLNFDTMQYLAKYILYIVAGLLVMAGVVMLYAEVKRGSSTTPGELVLYLALAGGTLELPEGRLLVEWVRQVVLLQLVLADAEQVLSERGSAEVCFCSWRKCWVELWSWQRQCLATIVPPQCQGCTIRAVLAPASLWLWPPTCSHCGNHWHHHLLTHQGRPAQRAVVELPYSGSGAQLAAFITVLSCLPLHTHSCLHCLPSPPQAYVGKRRSLLLPDFACLPMAWWHGLAPPPFACHTLSYLFYWMGETACGSVLGAGCLLGVAELLKKLISLRMTNRSCHFSPSAQCWNLMFSILRWLPQVLIQRICIILAIIAALVRHPK